MEVKFRNCLQLLPSSGRMQAKLSIPSGVETFHLRREQLGANLWRPRVLVGNVGTGDPYFTSAMGRWWALHLCCSRRGKTSDDEMMAGGRRSGEAMPGRRHKGREAPVEEADEGERKGLRKQEDGDERSSVSSMEEDVEGEEEEEEEEEVQVEVGEWKFLPTIRSGSVSKIGDRDHNEDARITVDDLRGDELVGELFGRSGYREGAFYAVIDGHGGSAASAFARQHLLRYVLEEETFKEDPKGATRAAFLRLDEDLRQRCEGEGGKCSGAVAVAAAILDGDLVVGNVGDCRAVISEKGKAVALSREHRPGTARDERERVLSSGTEITKRGYVGGAVAMTRAIGDWDRPGLKHLDPENGENTGPVLAVPEFAAIALRPEHEFLLLGSDGLWDALSSQEAVDAARRRLWQHGDPKRCAGELASKAIRAARKSSRADNVTVVAVCFPKWRSAPAGSTESDAS